jgi:hypothetical protein
MNRIGVLAALAFTCAASNLAAKPAKCLFVVDGEFYINGTCEFEHLGGGDFNVHTTDKSGEIEWSASLLIDDDQTATVSWNGDGEEGERHVPTGHQHASQNGLKRDGACWAKRSSVLCA